MKAGFDTAILDRLYREGELDMDLHYYNLRECALREIPPAFHGEIPDTAKDLATTFTAETSQAGMGIVWGVPPYEAVIAHFEFDKEADPGVWKFSKYSVRQMAAINTPMGIITTSVREKEFHVLANAIVYARHVGQEALDAAQAGLNNDSPVTTKTTVN